MSPTMFSVLPKARLIVALLASVSGGGDRLAAAGHQDRCPGPTAVENQPAARARGRQRVARRCRAAGQSERQQAGLVAVLQGHGGSPGSGWEGREVGGNEARKLARHGVNAAVVRPVGGAAQVPLPPPHVALPEKTWAEYFTATATGVCALLTPASVPGVKFSASWFVSEPASDNVPLKMRPLSVTPSPLKTVVVPPLTLKPPPEALGTCTAVKWLLSPLVRKVKEPLAVAPTCTSPKFSVSAVIARLSSTDTVAVPVVLRVAAV